MNILIFDNIPTSYRDELYNSIKNKPFVKSVQVIYNDESEFSRSPDNFKFDIKRNYLKRIFLLRYGREVKHNFYISTIPLRSIYKADNIIITGYSFPIYFFVAVIASALNRKLTFFWEISSPRTLAIKTFYLKLLAKCAHQICVPTTDAKIYLNHLNVHNVKIVHNGINITTDLTSDFGSREYDFLFVNRLSQEKGIDRLIVFLAQLNTYSQFYKIVIAGDGPLRSKLQEAVTKFENLEVTFLGWTDREHVLQTMLKSKALMSFSHFEPWGFSVTEALSRGCKVIATAEVASAKEYLQFCPDRIRLIEVGDNIETILPWISIAESVDHSFFDVEKQADRLIDL